MSPPIDRSDVEAFFDAYVAAFNKQSGHDIGALYAIPSVLMRGDRSVHGFHDRPAMESSLGQVAHGYRADGCVDWRWLDLHVLPIGSASVLASVTWQMLRDDDSVIRTWRHSYNLLRTEQGLRILAATFHVP